jgi:hypothetical protein
LESSTCWSKGNSKNVIVDPDGIQRKIVGRASQFGWLVSYSLDSSMTRPVGGIIAHLGVHKG